MKRNISNCHTQNSPHIPYIRAYEEPDLKQQLPTVIDIFPIWSSIHRPSDSREKIVRDLPIWHMVCDTELKNTH